MHFFIYLPTFTFRLLLGSALVWPLFFLFLYLLRGKYHSWTVAGLLKGSCRWESFRWIGFRLQGEVGANCSTRLDAWSKLSWTAFFFFLVWLGIKIQLFELNSFRGIKRLQYLQYVCNIMCVIRSRPVKPLRRTHHCLEINTPDSRVTCIFFFLTSTLLSRLL